VQLPQWRRQRDHAKGSFRRRPSHKKQARPKVPTALCQLPYRVSIRTALICAIAHPRAMQRGVCSCGTADWCEEPAARVRRSSPFAPLGCASQATQARERRSAAARAAAAGRSSFIPGPAVCESRASRQRRCGRAHRRSQAVRGAAYSANHPVAGACLWQPGLAAVGLVWPLWQTGWTPAAAPAALRHGLCSRPQPSLARRLTARRTGC